MGVEKQRVLRRQRPVNYRFLTLFAGELDFFFLFLFLSLVQKTIIQERKKPSSFSNHLYYLQI